CLVPGAGPENPVESLQDEATCTICLEYFKEPVSIHCGHNFCQACISQCWGESDTNFSCPQCRETAQQTSFWPNRELANVVEIIKRLRLQAAKGAGGDRVCSHFPQSAQPKSCFLRPQPPLDYPTTGTNVTLDPDTAHPCLVLSEDQKSVTWGDRRQKVPSSPKRFDSSRCVLGCEGFTSGKHYWEVELQAVGGMFAKLRAEMGEGYWVVGVVRESVRRKGVILLNPEEGVWALRKQRGQYAALTCPEILLSLSSIFSRIWVSLDYEGGQVTFFNVEDETPFFTFPPACFFGEIICPFFCVEGKGTWLRLCP
uniref:Uncharacterized protein n=1 Tax=Chrysemys picta bellii TaxID=8478 RepID=A0A8C3F4Y7_CHRPI